MRNLGYARVSHQDQNENRQLDALLAKGMKSENIYVDKVSGKNFNRPAYKRMVGEMEPGDVL